MKLNTPHVPKEAARAGYAVVGATDLVVERARETQDKAAHRAREAAHDAQEKLRTELSRERLVERVEGPLKKVQGLPEQAMSLPAAAVERGLTVSSKSQHTIDDLADRGRDLVDRIKARRTGAADDIADHGKAVFVDVAEDARADQAAADEPLDLVMTPQPAAPRRRKPAAKTATKPAATKAATTRRRAADQAS